MEVVGAAVWSGLPDKLFLELSVVLFSSLCWVTFKLLLQQVLKVSIMGMIQKAKNTTKSNMILSSGPGKWRGSSWACTLDKKWRGK
mmetsp:Transcript_13128/g.21568  ORF Transcript_13128/g.21568 Transcript_13128/m.21568 type:complete len:86 (+) Transcript_13128:749-1006(+)